jgi:deoxyadenosine/deoxycytidine kinase
MENKLIIVEGCDGAGKTTLVKNLKDAILKKNKKLKVKTLSLPNSTSFGYKKIREILGGKSDVDYPPDIVQSLFLANMIECNKKIIDPFFGDTEEDHILIVDRFIYSTIIYNIINSGTIFDAIQRYTVKTYNTLIKGLGLESLESNVIDFDIISKLYGQLDKQLDLIVFLNPPLDIVLQHAKNRNSEETNDDETIVKHTWMAYVEMAEFVTGHTKRTIIDYLESPAGMFIPDVESFDKYLVLNGWNRDLTEKENYENMKNAVLTKLNL